MNDPPLPTDGGTGETSAVTVTSMQGVVKQVAGAALRAGRKVTLVAAAKRVWDERLNMAVQAGISVFGENYAQDFARKVHSFDRLPVQWHFIGHLQRNKARKVVGVAQLIQTVDTLELAQHIHRICYKRGITQDVLLQVNIDEDPNKSGVAPDDLSSLLTEMAELKRVQVRGLMVLPSRSDMDERRASFRRARALFDDIAPHRHNFDTLSMGMSEDWREAIEEGSTMVRLGTVLFGERT